MGKLIYTAITSLDGFIEDALGHFDFAMPDEEVHQYINDLERPVSLYVYGRRLYETMRYWETQGSDAGDSAASRDYANIWRSADKVVFSASLTEVTTERTRLATQFSRDAISTLKDSTNTDVSIGGAELASHAFSLGLIDEVRLFVTPIVIGGGKPAFRHVAAHRWRLQQLQRFEGGVVYLSYQVPSA